MGKFKKAIKLATLSLVVLAFVILLISCSRKPSKNPVEAQSIKQVTKSSTPNLAGKNMNDLRLLNMPIECDVINLLNEKKSQRKEGEGFEVPAKLYINGNNIREEGVSVWTNGSETPALNIFTPKGDYTQLMDNSGRMAYIDPSILGGQEAFLNSSFGEIPTNDLQCKLSSFDDKVFVPNNVCYSLDSAKEPKC